MHSDHKIICTLGQHLFFNHTRLLLLHNQVMLGSKPNKIFHFSAKDFKPDLLRIQDNSFLNISIWLMITEA